MKDHFDVLVIGAGPAGLCLARDAARFGLDVALVDEQRAPGGQIYRNVGAADDSLMRCLGEDYARGRQLVTEFQQSNPTYFPGASLWYLDERLEAGLLIDGQSRFISCDRLVLATGAQERPMPLPGWQLPGVMTAGAGQILLKSASVVPDGRLILAGSGPLLLLLAWQYLQAGVEISAVIDTTPRANRLSALKHLLRALPAMDYLFKGMRLLHAIRRARIPIYRNVTELRAVGGESLQAVRFSRGIQDIQLAADTLMLHQGIIPNLRLAQAAGSELKWDDRQQCWKPSVNKWGQSSVSNLYIIGDSAGIVGAAAAELQGSLAALHIACSLQKIDTGQRDASARQYTSWLRRHLAIRPFLDALYAPAVEYRLPSDETLVCRCEEVFAGELRQAVRLGCVGPNQVKAFTRCGMGPCQGSSCGATLANLIADESGLSLAEVGLFRARPPFKPITLGELAGVES